MVPIQPMDENEKLDNNELSASMPDALNVSLVVIGLVLGCS